MKQFSPFRGLMRLQPKLQIKKHKSVLKTLSEKVVQRLSALTHKLEKLIGYTLNYALNRPNYITLHLRITTPFMMTSIWRQWKIISKDWMRKCTRLSLISPLKLALRTLRRELQTRTYRTQNSQSKTLTNNSSKLSKTLRILENNIATLLTTN